MISARNRLQPLSGNRWLLFIGIALLATACSPKVRPVTVQPKSEQPVVKKEPEKVIEKPVVTAQTVSVAMLLPFELDNLNPGAQYTATTITHADLSLDYYQGFKLALDSLAGKGYNFKLQLFDTKDLTSEAVSLGYNASIRSSNLIVGPVFPDDIHAFADILSGPPKLIVSPLSPASPSNIKNGNLVTVATPLEYHARAAAQFIEDHYKPKKVFILRSGFSDENRYLTPFKKHIDSLTKGKAKIISEVIQHGQLNGLVPQLSTTDENIFVVAATDQAFLNVTLHSLDSLAKKYKVTLFGHPSWSKFSYLKAGMMQDMKTHITSTDKADRKSPEVAAFIRNYRKLYHIEPTYYAMMGFDEGMYFGALFTEGPGVIKAPDKTDYDGLLNKYHFVKKPGLGWINTHVNILQYDNSELKRVE
ncbi:MAG: ABC transporter substrate-binding protein [Sphingobacteriales bacterium]